MAVTGKGDPPLLSVWLNTVVTRRSLVYANADATLETVMRDWAFDAVTAPPSTTLALRTLMGIGA